MVRTKTSFFFEKLTLTKILIIAFLIRLILSPLIIHGDVTTVYWWGKFATDFTWRGYYDWLEFGGYNHPDQPMLIIYYAYVIRLIFQFFYQIFWFLNTHIPVFPSKFMTWYFLYGNQFLIKLPFVFADLALIGITYKFIKKYFNYQKALVSSFILVLYLPLIYNSAVWGSGDSLINLLGLTAVYFLFSKKYLPFTLLIISSVLFKPSLLIWSPILLVIFLKNKPRLSNILTLLVTSAIYIYLVSFSFAITNPFIWFYGIMTQKILPGVMAQLTSNAMNFWALIYGLKPQLDEILIFNTISARNFSLVITFAFYIFICYRLYKNFSITQILLSLVQITLVTFSFMTRMHERYTFPALIPLLILCFYDKKFVKYFVILSLTHMLNIYHWWWFPQINFLVSFLSNEIVIRLISAINVLLTLKLLFLKTSNDSIH